MRSMTAYAYMRRREEKDQVEVVAKAINFKYLDIVVYRLPPEKILLEKKIREMIKGKIFRGRVEIHIFTKVTGGQKASINKSLLYDYFGQLKKVFASLNMANDLTARDLLTLPGLISLEGKVCVKDSLIIRAVNDTIERIVKFREKEGQAIKMAILKHLRDLKNTMRKVEKLKPKAKDKDVSKEDIDEEAALIFFYIKKMVALINDRKKNPKGKMIDFLGQELLKEFNTCASKTKKIKLASLLVEAKNYSERIREQAQNIE
ncbi:MAG: DUF1732 domain-containing protein [Candidatus Omnitrophica bacterium]|nr:DUF1732 domain-containing protein [Candidatus Omnitrophota bacterium]